VPSPDLVSYRSTARGGRDEMSICAQRQYAPTTMRIYTEHSRPMTLASSVQAGSFSARTPRDVFGDEPPVSPSTSTFGYGKGKDKDENAQCV